MSSILRLTVDFVEDFGLDFTDSDVARMTTTDNTIPTLSAWSKRIPLSRDWMNPVSMEGKLTTTYSVATSRTIPKSFVPLASIWKESGSMKAAFLAAADPMGWRTPPPPKGRDEVVEEERAVRSLLSDLFRDDLIFFLVSVAISSL